MTETEERPRYTWGQLRQAETWQRAQAWATWEKIKAGDLREVSKAELDADFDDALRRLAGPRSR